jgi:hypothetical protein
MQIEGKNNLEFMKRALNSHLTLCSQEATRGTDKETAEKWDPEIKKINEWLDAVEINLARFKEHPLIDYSKKK